MELLKKLPVRYRGELHQVKLINFTVEKEEVLPLLPPDLKPLDYNGRALISTVNVQLHQMHPTFLPGLVSFKYQHIGFRLLLDDRNFNKEQAQGIYFIRSFTDNPLVVFGGGLFTNYRLEQAEILNREDRFELRQKANFLSYDLAAGEPASKAAALKEIVGRLDRAYSHISGKLVRVQIMRESWPIEWLNCQNFQTNFFRTARFEGAFQVKGMIPYEWLPPTPVQV